MSDTGQPGPAYPGQVPAGYAPAPAAPPTYAPAPAPAPAAEPASIGQLISMLFKQMLKMLPLMIIMSVATFVGVWVLHTFLLVGPNEGFNAGGGTWGAWVLSQVLALQGRVASGSAFWLAFMSLGGAVVTGLIKRKGAFFSDLGQVPKRIGAGFAGGNPAIGTVLSGLGLALLLGGVLGNRLLAFIACGLTVLAIAEGPRAFPAIVLRCFYNDGRKALSKAARRLDDARGQGFLSGVLFGCLAFFVMFLLPDFAFTGLGVIALIFGILLVGQAPGAGATAALMLGLLVLVSARVAFGDDGGWSESGGSFADWIASEGAAQAVAMGLTPAAAAAIGLVLGILGTIFGTDLIGAVGAGSIPAGPVVPEPPLPPVPPVYPPEVVWTGPDGVTRVLTYNPEYGGYINNLTGGFVDPNNIAGWQQNIADTTAQTDEWRRRNAELAASGQDAQSQALQAIKDKYEAAQAQAAAQAEKDRKWLRDFYQAQRDRNAQIAKDQLDKAAWWDKWTKRIGYVEKGADIAINILATMTGPPGKAIKTAYTITKDITKNVSEANAQGTSLIKGAGKGILEAGFDVGFDKLKGTGLVQKIPGFGKYPGGALGGQTPTSVLKGLLGSGPDSGIIKGAVKDGVKGALQSEGQKWLVKDPIKKWVGLKS